MKEWAKNLPIHELDGAMWKDTSGDQLVVPPDDKVKQEILWVWHKHKGVSNAPRLCTHTRVCARVLVFLLISWT